MAVGKPLDAVLGQDDKSLFAPHDADLIMAHDRWVMSQDGPRTLEEFLSVQGGQRTYLTTKGPVHGPLGRVIGMFGISRDITEIKRAQQELRESEEDFKLLMGLMPVGVAWSNSTGRIEFVNGNFVERFGYTLSDIPTVEEWFLVAYPDPVYRRSITDAWRNGIATAQQQEAPVSPLEAKVTCKDGTVLDVIINTRLARNRTLAIFTDITERERVQKEILKTQKLESLGVLAGGIAHDFNNVLTGILGNISFAQMFLDPSHKASKPLQQAEQASHRAAELAHQLLTFAKGGKPNIKTVSAMHLVDESVALVLRGSNVRAVVTIPASLNAINVDEGQISQAFTNILINAAQAMPGGGVLTIVAENQQLNVGNRLSLPPGEYVKFTFKDEGCGIPEEDQKRIFDPYFSTKSGGNGLGLSSVHSIVVKHSGHIAVTSKPGKGTTFEIMLPSAGNIIEEIAADMAMSTSEQHAAGTVLVMDDEEMIRIMTTGLLEALGYQVRTCATGEEAVSLYVSARQDGQPYSAVIMDLTVPGAMGGKDAACRILADDPEARLIVSSGYSNDPVMAEYENYGFRGAVIKPYTAEEIARTLSKLLAHRQQ
jgi:PAS domain S-box-containing protein